MGLKTRFDLEQEIFNCWNVTSDLDTIYQGAMNEDLSNEQICNILLGLKKLYDIKFSILFDTFEEIVAKRDIR